jgi:hypothetical protein
LLPLFGCTVLYCTVGDKKSPRGKTDKKEFLRPNTKDTPKRGEESTSPGGTTPDKSVDSTGALSSFFSDADLNDPFPATFFQGDNFFKEPVDDQSTGSGHPFFSANQKKEKTSFDPRKYRATSSS